MVPTTHCSHKAVSLKTGSHGGNSGQNAIHSKKRGGYEDPLMAESSSPVNQSSHLLDKLLQHLPSKKQTNTTNYSGR